MLRYEYKYFVHNSRMDKLRQMILPFVRLDKFSEIMPEKHYTVRSIYFDSPNYDCYFEKVEGIKHRKKFRIRGYNQPDIVNSNNNKVFFEIKRKYENPIVKNRAPSIYDDVCHMFVEDDFEPYIHNSEKFPQAVDNIKRFFFHYHNDKLRPVILTIYEREAYLGIHDSTIRVTFDKNLRSIAFPTIDDLYSEHRVRNVIKDHFILEVKFNDYYPSWMKPVIGILGLKRESASKYVMSIDAHNMVNKKVLPNSFARGKLFRNIKNHY